MTSKRLGVGIVGAGFVARFHIRSWVGVRDADILGIVSRTSKSAAEAVALARSLGVGEASAFNSVTEMVADPAIDAVWICAPNFTRVEIMEEIVDGARIRQGQPGRCRPVRNRSAATWRRRKQDARARATCRPARRVSRESAVLARQWCAARRSCGHAAQR